MPFRAGRSARWFLDAALAACDGFDNVVDGLISNQSACDARFDPSTATLNGASIVCPAGQNNSNCLTPQMINALKIFGQSTLLPYRLASGENVSPGYTAWGTDLGIPATGMNSTQTALQPTVLTLTFGVQQPANPMPPAVDATNTPPYGSTFWDQWVKYFVTRDPNANPLSLDPLNPGPWQQRIIDLGAIQDANKTDFSALRSKGGKVLIAHGIHDGLVPNRESQQFMARVRSTMGSAAVADFMRYYEIPGYNHAVSTQFNAAWDSLTTLENWVENGTAPPAQVVADTAGVPGRTRPLCEYPSWPRYNGSGDVNSAASFSCVSQ
jgi:feruloyl esterase